MLLIVSFAENQRKVLLQTMVQAPGHSSPVFNDKILALYKQTARIAHVCYTPLLFLPRYVVEGIGDDCFTLLCIRSDI